MSAIAGIFNLDGRPVDRELLARMTDVVAYRGPDRGGVWSEGPVGLGHRMLCTTPESLRETQPLRDEQAQLCLVLDGRVDNRDELRRALLARGARLRDDTDAELVLRAYEVWGEACPKEIIGDFAFAVWDGRKRQLFCARDFLGIKPFYYYLDGNTFHFGSELHQILEDQTIRREPNEGMVGEYLADRIVSREETLYQSISRLPPAHAMIVCCERIRKQYYWQIDAGEQLHYKSDAEYAEHFLSVFEEAVRCRLRSHKPVGAYLSGGLDSSSVVGVAQSLIRDSRVQVAGFETFSVLFPEHPECDEREYIREVVDMWGLKWHGMLPNSIAPNHYAEQARFYRDFPDYPNGTDLECILEQAREAGLRVLLTGMGGDEWFFGGQYYYADLLFQLRARELGRELWSDVRSIGLRATLARLFSYGLRPLAPAQLRGAVRDRIAPPRLLSWIDPAFAARTRIADRERQAPIARLGDSYTRREMERILTGGHLAHSYETQDRMVAHFGVEERHPFNDRRVVELASMLPQEQRYRRFLSKFVLREAMRGLIPETVRQRTDKAEFSHLFLEALRVVGSRRTFENLAIAEIGWFSRSEVLAIYDAMERYLANHDEEYIRCTWRLWRIYGLEQWYLAHNRSYTDYGRWGVGVGHRPAPTPHLPHIDITVVGH